MDNRGYYIFRGSLHFPEHLTNNLGKQAIPRNKYHVGLKNI